MLHLNQYRDLLYSVHLAHLGLVWLYLIYYWATSRLRPPLTYVSLTLIYMSSLSELNVLPQGSTPHPPSGASHPSLSCVSSFTALHPIPHWAKSHPQLAASYPLLSYISFATDLSLTELHLIILSCVLFYWPCRFPEVEALLAFLGIMFYKVPYICVYDWTDGGGNILYTSETYSPNAHLWIILW